MKRRRPSPKPLAGRTASATPTNHRRPRPTEVHPRDLAGHAATPAPPARARGGPGHPPSARTASTSIDVLLVVTENHRPAVGAAARTARARFIESAFDITKFIAATFPRRARSPAISSISSSVGGPQRRARTLNIGALDQPADRPGSRRIPSGGDRIQTLEQRRAQPEVNLFSHDPQSPRFPRDPTGVPKPDLKST